MKYMDIDNSSILVTGGTGSFGQVFIKHLLKNYNMKRIVVYSRDELKQFEMQQAISHPSLRYFLGDIRDIERLKRALRDIKIIVHAAAIKQVVASEYNPIEAIKTNVLGAENIINAAIDCGVERVLALSTDKAVNPINLYGATKLCSDKLFVAANNLSGSGKTRFSVVRYGNVIGSRGSVIPFFKGLRKTGRLPITDPRMTRFWISVGEGAAFVDRSLQLMHGGEVFVPKIPSMKIVDLAAAVGPECKLDIIGIRPGEKLHEMLIPGDEAINTVEFADYYVIKPGYKLPSLPGNETYNGDPGGAVDENFNFTSDNNKQWMTVEQLQDVIDLS
jgi:UDP-N-acetylglucosamine 4,6-dehydratase